MLSADKVSKLILCWNEGSVKDFFTAEQIFASTREYTAALFFAHLSVEKALKAKIVSVTSEHAPFTHNLIHLASKLLHPVPADIEEMLSEINDFNLEGRYPDEKDSFRLKATQEFTQAKIKQVKEVLNWISCK